MNIINYFKKIILEYKLYSLKGALTSAGLIDHWIKYSSDGSITSYKDYENKLYPQILNDEK